MQLKLSRGKGHFEAEVFADALVTALVACAQLPHLTLFLVGVQTWARSSRRCRRCLCFACAPPWSSPTTNRCVRRPRCRGRALRSAAAL